VLSKAIHLLLRTGGFPLPSVMRRRYGWPPAGRPADAQQDPGARHAPEHALLLGRPGVGLSGTVVTGRLGLAQSAISRSVARGERLVAEKGASHLKRIIS